MNIVAIFSTIMTIIRYIPELLKIIKEVAKFIQDFEDKADAKKAAGDMAKAIGVARTTKDTSKIEDMFGPASIKFIVEKPVDSVDKPNLEEKKSLKLATFSLVANDLSFEKLITTSDAVIPLETGDEDAETFVQNEEPVIEESEPKEESNSVGFFSFASRAGSAISGASYVSYNYMGGGPRMSSRYFSSIAIVIILGMIGCRHTGAKNEPTYRPKVWAGDSEFGGVRRAQTNEELKATDPKFDNHISMTYDTFSCLYQTYIQNCREYKQKVVRCQKVSPEVIMSTIEQ